MASVHSGRQLANRKRKYARWARTGSNAKLLILGRLPNLTLGCENRSSGELLKCDQGESEGELLRGIAMVTGAFLLTKVNTKKLTIVNYESDESRVSR